MNASSKKKRKREQKALTQRSKERSDTEFLENPPKHFCNKRFLLYEKIGKGGFAFIFAGRDLTVDKFVAVKIAKKAKGSAERSIKREYDYLTRLWDDGCRVIPQPLWLGKVEDRRAFAMTRLGWNLHDLFKQCGKKFSVHTAAMLGTKLISLVENLHNVGLLHRDIKLQNFLTAFNSLREFYVCDFGLSAYYIQDGEHIPYSDGHKTYGTVRYGSMNLHKGIMQTRRDDLESIGWLLLYVSLGTLPWSSVRIKQKNLKWDTVYKQKKQTDLEDLCEALPEQFLKYMNSVFALKFDEKPDYNSLRALLFEVCGDEEDFLYDWE